LPFLSAGRRDRLKWDVCRKRRPHAPREQKMKFIMCLVFAVTVALPAPALAQERVPAKAALPQFQVDPFWPKPLPNNWILGQVSGIAVDRFDRIWVVHRPGTLNERELAAAQTPPTAKCCFAAPPVLVFDQSGDLLRAWGGPGQGYEWPQSEHGVFIDDNDFVWLAGNGKLDGQLLKFTMDGKFALQVGKSGPIRGSNDTTALGSPADVAVDVEAKEVYAADGYTNRRVVVFDSETGAYKRHWGAYGNKPSDDKTPAYDPAKPPSQEFGNPVHCIRISKDGLVYVCDRTNDRVQIFRKDGTFVAEHIYEKATRGTGSVYDLVFSPDKDQNFIYMIDGMNGEVRIVSRETNETLTRFGRPGRQVGQFTALHNIAVDHQGNIFTAEVNTGQRVQKFRRVDLQN
jgi:DNA-binding beta-propeller fold protein YncE